jgi:putative membrane protein insertion efficiency factor
VRWLIKIYQRYWSPFTAPTCRFQPTCSAYADEALERYGPVRGSWLALKRILRCQPFARHGYDPVPEIFSWWGSDPSIHSGNRAGDNRADSSED